VAALSTMRVSLPSQETSESFSFPWWTLGVAVVMVIAAVTAVYFVKIRKPSVKSGSQ